MNSQELFSCESEQSVLGGLMLDNNAWEKVKGLLIEHDFYSTDHQIIFRSLSKLLDAHQQVDALVLTDHLKNHEQLKAAGGEVYLFEIQNNTPSAANISAYAQIVKEKSTRRKIMQIANDILSSISTEANDLEITLIDAMNQLKTLSAHPNDINLKTACLAYNELLKADIPDRKLILPFLPEGGLAMVFGQRGLGKTQFSASLAYAVTSEQKFMNWDIRSNCGVLYVDGEMALSEMRERITNFSPSPPKNPLILLSHELFFEKFEYDLSITDEKTQCALLKLLDENKDIGLVILDNLSSLSRIREDKSDDWRTVMLPLLIRCRRRGIAVLIVHHSGKGGDQRGTGAREDALDAVIKLTELNDDDNSGTYFRVDIVKSRSCYGKDIRPFSAKLIDQNKTLSWEINSIEENTKNQLIQLLLDADEDGLFAKDIAEELGISYPMVSKYKKQLAREGIIEIARGKAPLRISKHGKQKYEN